MVKLGEFFLKDRAAPFEPKGEQRGLEQSGQNYLFARKTVPTPLSSQRHDGHTPIACVRDAFGHCFARVRRRTNFCTSRSGSSTNFE